VPRLPSGVKAGDRVNVFVANDNALSRVLDGVTVLGIGGKLPNPRAGEEGLTLVTIAETADKAIDADVVLAKAKDKVFFELAPAAAAPATSTPPGEVAVAKTPEPSATPKPAEPAKIAPKKLDAFVHGKTVTVVPDQEIVLELKGSTATPWELTKIDGDSVKQVGQVEFKPKADGAKDGTFTATFKAGKEGKAVIQFQSLMEPGKKDKMEVKFTVAVAAGG
jgi:uncharacterized protein YndB with AHSA1/START domain